MKKIIEYIKRPKELLIYMTNRFSFKFIPDKLFLKWKYRWFFNKKLNLENPQTFNEKLQWLKLHDRNPMYTNLVDKYEVRKYLSKTIGDEYLVPSLGVYDKFDDIDFDKLPNQFVIKCTHDSGGVVICDDKSKLDLEKTRKKIKRCLKRNYYYANREWPYKNIKPRIIIEEYLLDKENPKCDLVDYKVMCFNGEPKIIFTCTDRYDKGLKVTFFDLEWNKLPFERHYPSSKSNIEKPKKLKEMIELSRRMAKKFKFIRLDWYEVNNRLYFGEYTFYPGSGFEEFTPNEVDKEIGDLLELNYVERK